MVFITVWFTKNILVTNVHIILGFFFQINDLSDQMKSVVRIANMTSELMKRLQASLRMKRLTPQIRISWQLIYKIQQTEKFNNRSALLFSYNFFFKLKISNWDSFRGSKVSSKFQSLKIYFLKYFKILEYSKYIFVLFFCSNVKYLFLCYICGYVTKYYE